ncbi:hypothetical protein JA1_001116 [Spathaspora sp. JA1]|nr:hypothetical protein JA1_001116 [Spathaspora sp. JA1]
MTVRLFSRPFCIASRQFQLYAKTTINPKSFKLEIPAHIKPSSVLVLSTPSNLPQIIQNAIDLYQQHNLQIVVGGIDSVVPNSSRNGVSELWSEKPLTIKRSILLESRDDLNKPPKESDGIHIVTAKKNWKNIESKLCINFNESINADLKLANTVFSTGSILTLFYFQPTNLVDSPGNSGQHLCELEVALPQGDISEQCQITLKDNWTPLYEGGRAFTITNCVGNLLKTIDDKPASEFLEKNDSLMSIGSKETQVYVKLTNPNSAVTERFKVIAGGGGWGAKANIIALSPEAKPTVGSKIEFFMITPSDRYAKKYEDIDNYKNSITLQTTYEEQTYVEDTQEQEQTVIENAFGCGSESGFTLNGVVHNSPGEMVQIHL